MVKKRFWQNDVEAVKVIVLVFLILGTINVFSSSFILSEMVYHTPYFFLQRHAVNLLIACIGFIFFYRTDYHVWHKWSRIIVILAVVLLMLVLFSGTVVNGSRRWIQFLGVQIQPAEIAKLASIMLGASYLSGRLNRGQKINILSGEMYVILFMGVLVEMEPDMGTMCIIIGVPLFMLVIAGLNHKKIYALLLGAVAGGIGLCLLQPYRLARVKVMFDPWADAQNYGYQTVQSLSAIGSGGFWGMGLGMGISKYDYLPEAHTDFAFAIFSQENGFIGVLFAFFLFACLAFYSARIASKGKDSFGQMLATGVFVLIIGQAVINLAMVVGVGPVVGVPLPFISYGGTSLLVNLSAIGILLNIGRQALLEKKKQPLQGGEPEPPARKLRLVRHNRQPQV